MRAICVGETTIELGLDRKGRQNAFAGDVVNTNVCLAPEARSSLEADFVTGLGSDPTSDPGEACFRTEGLATAPAMAQGHAMAARVIGDPVAITPADAPRG